MELVTALQTNYRAPTTDTGHTRITSPATLRNSHLDMIWADHRIITLTRSIILHFLHLLYLVLRTKHTGICLDDSR